jgi:hypothetical protein
MTPTELTVLMIRHDMTKDDVAKISGVSTRSVHSWQTGQYPIPRSVSIVLQAYDDGKIEFDWLVNSIEKDMRERLAVI